LVRLFGDIDIAEEAVQDAFEVAKAAIAEAHRVSEDGHVRGKLVLVVGSPPAGRPPLGYPGAAPSS
jgi:hypothetical protein